PPIAAHAPGEMMTRPHARGIRRGADRARGTMEHRAVRRVAAVPAVALDAALEALALRDADNVDQLTRREHLDGERLAELVALNLFGLLESDLAHDLHRRHVQLLEHARRRLRHVLLLRAEPELQRIVPVRLRRLDADDRAGPSLDDGHRHVTSVVGKHLRHPHFSTDQSFFTRHGYSRSSRFLLELLHLAADQ